MGAARKAGAMSSPGSSKVTGEASLSIEVASGLAPHNEWGRFRLRLKPLRS